MWGEGLDTDRADGMDLGEGGLRVSEAAGGEIEEAVTLVAEAVEVSPLVPALVRRVHRQGLVLLNVLHPPPQIWLYEVTPDQVSQPSTSDHAAG